MDHTLANGRGRARLALLLVLLAPGFSLLVNDRDTRWMAVSVYAVTLCIYIATCFLYRLARVLLPG